LVKVAEIESTAVELGQARQAESVPVPAAGERKTVADWVDVPTGTVALPEARTEPAASLPLTVKVQEPISRSVRVKLPFAELWGETIAP